MHSRTDANTQWYNAHTTYNVSSPTRPNCIRIESAERKAKEARHEKIYALLPMRH